jgi:hypothetical protein
MQHLRGKRSSEFYACDQISFSFFWISFTLGIANKDVMSDTQMHNETWQSNKNWIKYIFLAKKFDT